MNPLLEDAIRRKRRIAAAHRAERWLRLIAVASVAAFLAVAAWRAMPRMLEGQAHVSLPDIGIVRIDGECMAGKAEAIHVRVFRHGDRYYSTCVPYNPSGGWGQ